MIITTYENQADIFDDLALGGFFYNFIKAKAQSLLKIVWFSCFNPSHSLGGAPPWTTFFNNSKTTYAMVMKLWHSGPNLVANILKLK